MTQKPYKSSLCIDKTEQNKIENYKLLLIGTGIGSVIAECALRFGFKNITLTDKEYVEADHLNSQNYTQLDIGKLKTECLSARLLEINPEANIQIHTYEIDKSNVKELIRGYDIVINTLNFTNELPFLLNEICKEYNIPILYSYSLEQTGVLIAITPDSIQLNSIFKSNQNFERELLEYVTHYLRLWGSKAVAVLSPSSIISWELASLCVNVVYNLATDKAIKKFPKFYLSSVLTDKI